MEFLTYQENFSLCGQTFTTQLLKMECHQQQVELRAARTSSLSYQDWVV